MNTIFGIERLLNLARSGWFTVETDRVVQVFTSEGKKFYTLDAALVHALACVSERWPKHPEGSPERKALMAHMFDIEKLLEDISNEVGYKHYLEQCLADYEIDLPKWKSGEKP